MGEDSKAELPSRGRLALKIFSGEASATSSMSTPPSGLPTMTGPSDSRSIRMAK